MAEKLESLIENKYNTALQNGSLFFFETETETKSEAGIEFQITHAPSLLAKPKLKCKGCSWQHEPVRKPKPRTSRQGPQGPSFAPKQILRRPSPPPCCNKRVQEANRTTFTK
ncbi:unnamed protein product [Umbelopsis ramanniana]